MDLTLNHFVPVRCPAGMRFAAEFLDTGAVLNRSKVDKHGGMFGKSPLVNRMALHNNKAGRLVSRCVELPAC